MPIYRPPSSKSRIPSSQTLVFLKKTDPRPPPRRRTCPPPAGQRPPPPASASRVAPRGAGPLRRPRRQPAGPRGALPGPRDAAAPLTGSVPSFPEPGRAPPPLWVLAAAGPAHRSTLPPRPATPVAEATTPPPPLSAAASAPRRPGARRRRPSSSGEPRRAPATPRCYSVPAPPRFP